MYAAGFAIRPLRSRRPRAVWRLAARAALVALVVVMVGLGLAGIAHGGSPAPDVTVVVQPGDTLWSIAASHYPADDVRVRVDDIEQANGLHSPVIEVGQTLRLPG
ncbi:MAG: LysM peptidoglycan-binding domain-containing protein [Candidatus Dormibacterales bacterium]